MHGAVLPGLGRRCQALAGTSLHRFMGRVTDEVGGPARRKAVLLLAAVLALDAADKGAVGAVAFQLEQSLHIGNTQVGLAVTVTSLVGAVATLPVGAVVDRAHRVRLLWASIVLWGVAQFASGLSPSYSVFLFTRLALGGVAATAGPTVASLTGDLFPAGERGKMYGFILTGEVLGTGAGILVAGFAATLFGWRAAFLVLAVPAGLLAWTIRRFLPEPARGGQSRIGIGDEEIVSQEEIEDQPGRSDGGAHADAHGDEESDRNDTLVADAVAQMGIPPEESIVLGEEAVTLNLWQAIRYCLRVRTNLILIVASSLGYFFFSGLQTFTLIFLREHFGMSQGGATLLVIVVGVGVIGGLLVAGNLGDKLIRNGHLDGRILIGAFGFLLAAVFLAPGIVSTSLAVSVPLFVLAGIAVSAPNPGLDAARLDVMPARMWGRAEAVRTVLRQTLVAFAPLLFGVVSEAFGGGRTGFGSGVNLTHGQIDRAHATSLEYTFLLMLVTVVAGGLILLRARRTYPSDVASATESDRRHHQTLTAGPD